MTDDQRLRLLEDLGRVPSDPDMSDYRLAEKTSWWGKRIDPIVFWSDKVVWYDDVAEFEARRRGRGYPPMPYEDPSVADRSDQDRRGDGFEIEGPNIHYVSSERESVFWGKFIKTHPHPPDDITRWQQERAGSWLRHQHILEHAPEYAARLGLTSKSKFEKLEADRRQAMIFGYPPECLTPDAYRWSHSMQKRQEYEALQDAFRVSGREVDEATRSNFFRHVYVDRKYITEPLGAEDMQAANAWKVAYLRRLRQENTDEAYINAYLQAWNISSNYVFGLIH
jgi:hypothetical protein